MTSRLGRGLWRQGGAALALALHLFLVGFAPAGESLHDHGHAPGAEWHTDGSHEHGDAGATECPLFLAQPSTGLVVGEAARIECAPVVASVESFRSEQLRSDVYASAASARGPPKR